MNLHDQGSIIEPCQPNLNETDWMFFQAVENYVRYADGLMNEINLLEQNKGSFGVSSLISFFSLLDRFLMTCLQFSFIG